MKELVDIDDLRSQLNISRELRDMDHQTYLKLLEEIKELRKENDKLKEWQERKREQLTNADAISLTVQEMNRKELERLREENAKLKEVPEGIVSLSEGKRLVHMLKGSNERLRVDYDYVMEVIYGVLKESWPEEDRICKTEAFEKMVQFVSQSDWLRARIKPDNE